MSNSLIDAYRQKMADAGNPDTRDDYFVMQDLAPLAQQDPTILDRYPDFARDYGALREANAPSLGQEASQAFKSGMEETGATYAGLGALAKIPGAKDEAKKLESEAAETPATIQSMQDIAPGETGLSRVFSKDTARYLTAKAAGAIPSLLEMAGLSLTGAALGSAGEPGAGTIAGGVEGGLEAVLNRGIIKSAIKSLLEEGVGDKLVESKVIDAASEQGIKDAILKGDQNVADLVTRQAKSLAAGRSEALVNYANVYGMSAGGIYNETGDRGKALGLGAAAAAVAAPPFLSLPARIARGLFPKLSAEAAQSAADDLVGKKTAELLAKLGRAGEAAAAGTAGVLGMEAAGIVAKNLAAGKDALDLDDSDWKRLREAAVGGALGSLPFAALAARSPTEEAVIPRPGAQPAAPEGGAEPAPAAPAPAAEPGTAPSTLDITRSVLAMDPDAQRARLATLEAVGERTPPEETEYQQLKAIAPAAPKPIVSAPAPEPVIPPTEPVPDETSPAAPEPMEAAPAAAPVDIGPRNPEISTGTGTETPAETEMMARWREQNAADLAAKTAAPTIAEAGFRDQAHFSEEYAANHERDAYETEDEFLKRTFCQQAA